MGNVTQTPGGTGLPGLGTRITMKTRKVLLLDSHAEYMEGATIDKDTVDAGGTPTTELRPGMVLVRVETGGDKGKWVQYGHASAPGSAGAIKRAAVLLHFLEMRDETGTTVDKPAQLLAGGFVDEGQALYVSVDAAVIAAMKAAAPRIHFVPALA